MQTGPSWGHWGPSSSASASQSNRQFRPCMLHAGTDDCATGPDQYRRAVKAISSINKPGRHSARNGIQVGPQVSTYPPCIRHGPTLVFLASFFTGFALALVAAGFLASLVSLAALGMVPAESHARGQLWPFPRRRPQESFSSRLQSDSSSHAVPLKNTAHKQVQNIPHTQP